MQQYRITLTGTSPLLMHHDNLDWADEMTAWKNNPDNKKLSIAGDDRTPAFRWLGCCYHDGQQLAMPQANIMRAIMEGGTQVPVPGGRGGKTFKAQTQSGMGSNATSYWPLTLADGRTVPWSAVDELKTEPDFNNHRARVADLGFSLLVKRALINKSSKHVRVRPQFDTGWTLTGTLFVWDEQITRDILATILDYAGRFKGLGDWRPGSKTPGPYGMFSAEID